jgi:hypothetical protein
MTSDAETRLHSYAVDSKLAKLLSASVISERQGIQMIYILVMHEQNNPTHHYQLQSTYLSLLLILCTITVISSANGIKY